jgi:hypothetical protein
MPKLAERVVRDIGAALHVVDAGAERAVALDLERQAIDEPHRMDRIEMAQDQDPRRVLPPGRTRHQVIAQAIPAWHALDGRRQAAIEIGHQRCELVDLCRNVRRRLDLDPAADAVEDIGRIEGV